LENRRSKNDKVFRRMWEAVETKARKTGVEKAKRRRGKMKRGGKSERKKEEEEIERM